MTKPGANRAVCPDGSKPQLLPACWVRGAWMAERFGRGGLEPLMEVREKKKKKKKAKACLLFFFLSENGMSRADSGPYSCGEAFKD